MPRDRHKAIPANNEGAPRARGTPATRPASRAATMPRTANKPITRQPDLASPTEATSRCYYLVVTNHGLDHWGRYLDRYCVRGGRWLFAHRRQFMDGAVPGSWADFALAAGG